MLFRSEAVPAEGGEAVSEAAAVAEKGDDAAKVEKKPAARRPRKAKEKASAE